MDPVQVYETTIYDREVPGQALTFLTLPARSLRQPEPPPVEDVARELGVLLMDESPRAFRRNVRPWGLPFLIDGALGRRFPFRFYFDPDVPFGEKDGPSRFAEYLAFEAIVPWESSPLGSKALATLITSTGAAGAALGYGATGEPIVLLTVPAGIVIVGTALGLGAGAATGLAEGVRYRIRRLMGVPDDEPQAPDNEA